MKIENWTVGECEARQQLDLVEQSLEDIDEDKKSWAETYYKTMRSLIDKIARRTTSLHRLGVPIDGSNNASTNTTKTNEEGLHQLVCLWISVCS
jgi:hypothetical protein